MCYVRRSQFPKCLPRWKKYVFLLISVIDNTYPHLLAIQGLGGGGLIALANIILADLVPLQERGLFNGLIGM